MQKVSHWLTILYEESCNPEWKKILEESGFQAIASPVHDRDRNDSGELKKPHRHLLLKWDGPTTRKNAKAWIEILGGVGVIPCASERGSARYFCHLDNPEKIRYRTEDVLCFGGMVYEDIIMREEDDIALIREVFDFCEDHKIVSYRELMILCRRFRPDWERMILKRYRENVFRYLRSFENDVKTGRYVDMLEVEDRFREFFGD